MKAIKVKKDEKFMICAKICSDAVITTFQNLKDYEGQYCAVCYKIVPGTFKKKDLLSENEKQAKTANYEQPKAKKPIKNEVKEKVKEEKAVAASLPKEPVIKQYQIADVLPTENLDIVKLCFVTENGEPFYVSLKSTPEKTTQILNSKQALINKLANIEYLSIDEEQIPTNPVFKGLVK